MRQTNLFGFLEKVKTAVEQELHKQSIEESDTGTVEDAVTPSLEEITKAAYRKAITIGDSQSALHYWHILKDMNDVSTN